MQIPTPDPAWDQTCRANDWIGSIVNRGISCRITFAQRTNLAHAPSMGLSRTSAARCGVCGRFVSRKFTYDGEAFEGDQMKVFGRVVYIVNKDHPARRIVNGKAEVFHPDQPGLIESVGAKRTKELCREEG